MPRKFDDKQMKEIHSRYYEPEGFVRRDETTGRLVKEHLRVVRSEVTDEIIREDREFFDLLEMDEQDCIRFNFTRYNACGCRYHLWDRNDLERLRDFLDKYLNDKI